jgi:hypothetical protein
MDIVRLQLQYAAEFDRRLVAPAGIRERNRQIRQYKRVFGRDRPGEHKAPHGVIGLSAAVKQFTLFDQGIQMVWSEFEHLVQMADSLFQVASFCDHPREQQKNVGLAIAMIQQPQIARFCVLEIAAGMMSRSTLQELQKEWRDVTLVLIGRHVPAFTLYECGAKQHPAKACLKTE